MARILQSGDFQQDNDPAAEIAEEREARIRRSVLEGLAAMAIAIKAIKLASITNVTILIASIRGVEVQNALLNAYKPVNDTFTDAAEAETSSKLGRLVVYDPVTAALTRAQAQKSFIAQIQDAAEMVARQTLVNGLRQGLSAEELAKNLEQVISLSPRQSVAVANYRRLLEQGSKQALDRALRDKRFDDIVANAIARGDALREGQIDLMVERYAKKSVQQRAAMIARTESINAATGGIRDAYVQAVKSGRLLDGEVRRHWQLVLDERLCPICASIPILNPNGVGVFEPYLSARGPVMTTGIHPNCRCSERYSVNLNRLQSSPFATAA